MEDVLHHTCVSALTDTQAITVLYVSTCRAHRFSKVTCFDAVCGDSYQTSEMGLLNPPVNALRRRQKLRCQWTVQAPKGFLIHLKFDKMDDTCNTQCSSENVTIQGVQDDQVVICHEAHIPHEVISLGSRLSILYMSWTKLQRSSCVFRMRYQVYGNLFASSNCHKNFVIWYVLWGLESACRMDCSNLKGNERYSSSHSFYNILVLGFESHSVCVHVRACN